MVLDLKVQSAQEPRRHPAVPCEVDAGLHLMDGPGVVDAFGVLPRQRELRLLHAVCKLKHDAQQQAQDERPEGSMASP